MKKYLSFLMAFLMVFCLLSAAAVSSFAEEDAGEEETPAEKKEFVLYISDDGDDSNNGRTAETPLKTWVALVNRMNANVKNDYNCGKVVIVGTSSASTNGVGLQSGEGWKYPLTITSDSKETARFVVDGTFRVMGETLFTNLKIVGTAGKVLYADAFNVTFGAEGVENDIVCEGTVNVSVGWPSTTQVMKRDFVCTFNSGTYANIYGEGRWGHQLVGNAAVIINGGTFTGGVMTIGGDYNFSGSGGLFACTGDYTVQINGGTFDNQTICIGWANKEYAGNGIVLLEKTAFEKVLTKSTEAEITPCVNIFGGKVTLDINGGSFTGCDGKIAKGSTLDPDNCMAESLIFHGGVEINIGDIPYADKAAYKALVAQADQTLLVDHNYDVIEQIAGNDEKHKAKCDCGCEGSVELPHHFDEGTVITAATHKTDGTIKYTCENCGYEKNAAIPADPDNHLFEGAVWEKHNETQHKRKCTDPECDYCEYADHKWDNGTVTKEATHTEEGTTTYTCTVCGETRSEAIPKTEGHTMGEWEYADENRHKRSCACGETKFGDHVWDEGTITKAATESEDGVKTYTCSICNGTKTEVIPKTGAAEKEVTGCGSTLSVGFALCLTVALSGTCVLSKKFKKD